MNLKDLNNIDIKDLKNIDWQEVKARVQSQPDVAINALLILVTLVVMFSAFNKHKSTVKSLKTEVVSLRKKSEVLDKFEALQKQNNDFLKDIPKAISGDQLITILSEFAINRNVQILSFSPTKEKSNSFINLTNVKINIMAEDYNDIILFMHDIEDSPYSVRIGAWSGTLSSPDGTSRRRSRRSTRETTSKTAVKEYIEATVEIESVEFKNV